jgi:membrane protein implicated in regulation of membrane protease activity
MLEEASWIASIIGAVIALAALIWTGRKFLNRSNTKQDARISGNKNTVNQSAKIEKDK